QRLQTSLLAACGPTSPRRRRTGTRRPTQQHLPVKKERVERTETAVFPGVQGGPLMHALATRTVALGEALKKDFRAHAALTVTRTRTIPHERTARRPPRRCTPRTVSVSIVVTLIVGATGRMASSPLRTPMPAGSCCPPVRPCRRCRVDDRRPRTVHAPAPLR